MKSLSIGNIKLKNPLFLSPMVEVTDLAYRMLCRKWVGMAYTEMLYLNALMHENPRTRKLMSTNKADKPVGLQITGNSIEEFKKFAKLKELHNYDLIDINCGCPSIRITGNEAGSYLLKNPDKIAGMIKVLKDSGLVVTAKIRLGYKENNVLKVAKEIEKAGADALTIHARLAHEGGSIPADWAWIKKVKKEVGISVIGNGDVDSGRKAGEMLDICDGVMIARAAIGNPFIFREILRYFRTGKEKEVTKNERIIAFSDYLRLAEKHKIVDIGRMKYLGSNFLKGFDGAAKAREGIMKLKSFEEIANFIETLKI